MSAGITTTLDPSATLEEIEDQFLDLAGDDEPDVDSAIAMPAPEKPKELTKAEKKAAKEEENRLQLEREAKDEQARIQALVPWKVSLVQDYQTRVLSYDGNDYRQSLEIDRWADDSGVYPRRYRAYSREEWTLAIDQIAAAVGALAVTDPAFQRSTGLYVEEHTKDMLLIVAKHWQLQIQVPSTSKITGKRFDLKANPQASSNSYGTLDFHGTFIELLTSHIAGENRELILDICCQYLRTVRLKINRATWAAEHPELAIYMLPPSKR